MSSLFLIQGPAGAGKSQVVDEMLEAGEVDLVADSTLLWVAVSGVRRGPDGRYPVRPLTDPSKLTALYLKTVTARFGLSEGFSVAVTASARNIEEKWRQVADVFAASLRVRTVDPGEDVVRARLSEPDGKLSDPCAKAIRRWHGVSDHARRTFEVEIRESSRPGYEPSLHATILQEGRASSDPGIQEVFTPGSVQWPSEGIAIMTEHRGRVETRAQPVRARDGRITIRARATDAIKAAVAAGATRASIEFHALESRRTGSGIREVIQALVTGAALTSQPAYDSTRAEIRSKRRMRVWL